MEVEYTFGHSVDVDGDEWIDLGPMPEESQEDDDCNNPFSSSSIQALGATTTVEPVVEPEPEVFEKTVEEKTIPAPVYASRSKATRSKEALMAFYLDRAKQMEAKHKKIIVSSTESVVIHSLQEPERIGI